jgi:hypothetical protein
VQERGHAVAPPARFDEARAEQVLWQEFRDHSASINNALNEALRVHRGPSRWIFQVRVFARFEARSFIPFTFARFLISRSPTSCLLATGAGGPSPGVVQPPHSIEL